MNAAASFCESEIQGKLEGRPHQGNSKYSHQRSGPGEAGRRKREATALFANQIATRRAYVFETKLRRKMAPMAIGVPAVPTRRRGNPFLPAIDDPVIVAEFCSGPHTFARWRRRGIGTAAGFAGEIG